MRVSINRTRGGALRDGEGRFGDGGIDGVGGRERDWAIRRGDIDSGRGITAITSSRWTSSLSTLTSSWMVTTTATSSSSLVLAVTSSGSAAQEGKQYNGVLHLELCEIDGPEQ